MLDDKRLDSHTDRAYYKFRWPLMFKEEKNMSIERMVLAFAGSFVLISLILSQLFSPYWLLFTAFVVANLFQSAFTGFCPLAKILKAMGAKPSSETFKF